MVERGSGMGYLSLKRLHGRDLGGASSLGTLTKVPETDVCFGDPEGFGEKGSRDGHVRFIGNPERKL
jgi:hypothetical protein